MAAPGLAPAPRSRSSPASARRRRRTLAAAPASLRLQFAFAGRHARAPPAAPISLNPPPPGNPDGRRHPAAAPGAGGQQGMEACRSSFSPRRSPSWPPAPRRRTSRSRPARRRPGTYKAVLRVPHGCEGEATLQAPGADPRGRHRGQADAQGGLGARDRHRQVREELRLLRHADDRGRHRDRRGPATCPTPTTTSSSSAAR